MPFHNDKLTYCWRNRQCRRIPVWPAAAGLAWRREQQLSVNFHHKWKSVILLMS